MSSQTAIACVDVNDIMAAFGDWTLRLDVQVFYSTLYATIFVVGLIGNGLLIGSLAKRKRISVPNIFLINLAISDLVSFFLPYFKLLCITALPITPVLAFVKRWLFGSLLCKLVPLCQGISVLISSYCLCFIAVDRYRNIVIPTKEPWTTRRAHSLMAISWLTSATVSSPLFITQRLQPLALENTTLCGYFCGEYSWPEDNRIKLFYGSALLICQYLIPVSIMTFCYWKILQKVRADWIVAQHSMLTVAQQAQTAVRKRRVMYVLILMVVVFMASWFPLTIVNIFRDFGIGTFLDVQMYFKLLNVHALAMTSIVWNPLLYFWMSKRHRKAFKEDMFGMGNVRHARRNNNLCLMNRLYSNAPLQPPVNILYKRAIERNLIPNLRHYRRGTLIDPTCVTSEQAFAHINANCFLLQPLLPLYLTSMSQKSRVPSHSDQPD